MRRRFFILFFPGSLREFNMKVNPRFDEIKNGRWNYAERIGQVLNSDDDEAKDRPAYETMITFPKFGRRDHRLQSRGVSILT